HRVRLDRRGAGILRTAQHEGSSAARGCRHRTRRQGGCLRLKYVGEIEHPPPEINPQHRLPFQTRKGSRFPYSCRFVPRRGMPRLYGHIFRPPAALPSFGPPRNPGVETWPPPRLIFGATKNVASPGTFPVLLTLQLIEPKMLPVRTGEAENERRTVTGKNDQR